MEPPAPSSTNPETTTNTSSSASSTASASANSTRSKRNTLPGIRTAIGGNGTADPLVIQGQELLMLRRVKEKFQAQLAMAEQVGATIVLLPFCLFKETCNTAASASLLFLPNSKLQCQCPCQCQFAIWHLDISPVCLANTQVNFAVCSCSCFSCFATCVCCCCCCRCP